MENTELIGTEAIEATEEVINATTDVTEAVASASSNGTFYNVAKDIAITALEITIYEAIVRPVAIRVGRGIKKMWNTAKERHAAKKAAKLAEAPEETTETEENT